MGIVSHIAAKIKGILMKQILIFGDSILKGVTYNDEISKHKLLHDHFSTLREMGYAVKNCSLMGATITEGRCLIEKKMTEPASDTIVLLEYGGNDCDYRWADISADPTAAHMPKTPMEHFVEKYKSLVAYVQDRGATVYICNLVPLDAEKYIRWISRGLNYETILGWLGDTSMLYRWHEWYSRTTEQLAQTLSCPLIDLRMPFLLSHRYPHLLSSDGIHPTPEGHRVVEETIAKALS